MRAGLDINGAAHAQRLKPFFMSLFGHLLRKAMPLAILRASARQAIEVGPSDVTAALKYLVMDGHTTRHMEEIAMARIEMRAINFDAFPDLSQEEASAMLSHLGNEPSDVVGCVVKEAEDVMRDTNSEVQAAPLEESLRDDVINARWSAFCSSSSLHNASFTDRLLIGAVEAMKQV